MNESERLKRLKELVDRLERLPASAERDRLLADARGRFVDVDTGERTQPRREAEPAAETLAHIARSVVPAAPAPAPAPPAAARPPAPAPAPRSAAPGGPRPAPAPRPAAPDPAPPAPASMEPAEPSDWGLPGDWLSLDDDPPVAPADKPDDDAPPPWRLGLRG
jgi:hypothetical protein